MVSDNKPAQQWHDVSKLCSACLEKCRALCLKKQDTLPSDRSRWIVVNDYSYKSGSLLSGTGEKCVLCEILSQLGDDQDWIQAKWSIHYLPNAECDSWGLVDFDQLRIDFYKNKVDVAKSQKFNVRAAAGTSSLP
jgi:hypothetical protein